ncbi:DUF4331 domain-containing protein [Actinomadura rudentiformis]|uniref:DUF4331 domain-containing protein n=1 Tax=Actinomadura rudentiformis TaxID=359158 RepID=A0A6H9Z043_9ACTN|nr:DUF4331 domain-containing protein [Actinomadura rudentiformis]KAB2347231.1 DUF4331 domain-containing protein [Actinomadura rudentiformis]
MPKRLSRRSRTVGVLATGAALIAGGSMSLAPMQATASSHREAPLISGQPEYDNTDVYAFVSPDQPNTTTLVANFWPFEEPAGGPNFYKFNPDGRYEINVDNDGDSLPEFTYRFTFKESYRDQNTFLYNTGVVRSFNDPTLNYRQTYDLTLIQRNGGTVVGTRTLATNVPVAPSHVGDASMPDYRTLRQQAIKQLPSGAKVFAGQADDPFFLDLRVFDRFYGGKLKEVGNDTLRGYNVQTVALQVPTSALIKPGQPVIGVYSAVQRKNAAGSFTQVSRLANPLVNEVVNPIKDKDKFNASVPWNDAQFLSNVTNPELARRLNQVYKLPIPPTPRNDLVQVFLTGVPKLNQPPNVRPAELMRLNTSIPPAANPKRLGVLDGDNAGYPNGRRLTDDTVDISLQVVEGELVGMKNDLSDSVDANDVKFEPNFPYVALPTSGSAVRGGFSGSGGKSGNGTATTYNFGNRSAQTSTADDGGTPILPIIALAGGAAFLTGGFLMWARRRSI